MQLVDYTTMFSAADRWQRFEHRPGDVVVSTPPKAGTTRMQKLVAQLLHGSPELPAPLDELSPWLDMRITPEEEVMARLAAQSHRRVIKTHTPLDGLPLRDDVTYVVVGRDPRDIMVSFEHHMANVDFPRVMGALAEAGVDMSAGPPPGMVTGVPDDPEARFRAFIDADDRRNEDPSLASIVHHLADARRRQEAGNVVVFHYRDLQADLVTEMERLAQALGTGQDRATLGEMAEAASLGSMRANAAELIPESRFGIFLDPEQFFRSGGAGEWQDRGGNGLATAYQERVEKLVAPERAGEDWVAWLHVGRL
jgi:hypothetical protein